MKICLLGLCMTMGLTACSPKLTDSAFDESKINRTQDVVMRTEHEEYPFSSEQIELIISNNTVQEVVYGTSFTLQIYKENQWKTISFRKDFDGFLEPAMHIPANESVREHIDLRIFDFKFEAGKYRVIKEISTDQQQLVSAEFTMK